MKSVLPKVATYIRIIQLINCIVYSAILAALIWVILHFNWPIWMLYTLVSIFLLWFIIQVVIGPSVYIRVTKYKIDHERIIVRKGLISVETKMIPIERVQGVVLRNGPISRTFDLSKIEVSTASLNLELPPISTTEATQIQEEINMYVRGEWHE